MKRDVYNFRLLTPHCSPLTCPQPQAHSASYGNPPVCKTPEAPRCLHRHGNWRSLGCTLSKGPQKISAHVIEEKKRRKYLINLVGLLLETMPITKYFYPVITLVMEIIFLWVLDNFTSEMLSCRNSVKIDKYYKATFCWFCDRVANVLYISAFFRMQKSTKHHILLRNNIVKSDMYLDTFLSTINV